MVGWHHQLNGHEFAQTLGDGEGQGSLACFSQWGCKERLNNTVFLPRCFIQLILTQALVLSFSFSQRRLLEDTEFGKLPILYFLIRSDQIRSVTQLCPTLCDPMNHSTPGLPVHHQLPEFTQTHIHRVNDAIQPSHLLSSPSPPAPNPSQHHSLFQ